MADIKDNTTSLSVSTLLYFFHHVFLPPKLPDGDDSSSENEYHLMLFVEQCLQDFSSHMGTSESRDVVQAVVAMIRHMRTVRDSNGHIHEESLREAMSRASSSQIIPLNVTEQNAGVIISFQNQEALFEMFELAPDNVSAMSTVGRLIRRFPAVAVAVPRGTYDDGDFQKAISNSLATMSHQAVPAMKPRAPKSGQKVLEVRETIKPDVVTELFTSFLLGVGKPSEVTTLTKNTREEVMWNSSKLPWRRSPNWLLVRVALQLAFTKGSSSAQLYKEFMVFFLSKVLDAAVSRSLDSDVLYVMYAKISRRALKLPGSEEYGWLSSVLSRVKRATKTVQNRWNSILELEEPPLNLKVPSCDVMERGTYYELPELDAFITSIMRRKKSKDASVFNPKCWLQLDPSSRLLPTELLDRSRDEYHIFRLKTFESWVSTKLDEWVEQNTENPGACHGMADLLISYHDEAQTVYSGHPELLSQMLLTVLQLWVAIDELVCTRLPLLRDYNHEIPVEVFQSLILAHSRDMEKLAKNEKYLQDRNAISSKMNYPSTFCSYGEVDSFQARYFSRETYLQDVLEVIEAKASLDRARKTQELRDMQQKHADLMRQYRSRDCELHTLYDASGQPYDVHRWGCSRCRLEVMANKLTIDVHEWPLPQDGLSAQCTVFELNPPRDFCTWRDVTWYLIVDVLRSNPKSDIRPEKRFTLEDYQGLSQWQSRTWESRIHLLSETKPHPRTHRKNHRIPDITVDDVCVNNGLQLGYFDRKNDIFVSPTSSTTGLSASCTVKLPSRSSGLQRFLQRSFENPLGHTPNQIIASQHMCPHHLSILEGRSLMSLGYGCNTLWLNILTQLSSPEVDFTKVETVTFLFQLTFQAGPPSRDGDLRRTSHKRLASEEFCSALEGALRNCVSRIEENRESYFAMWCFNVIAIKALSLSTNSQREFHGLLDHVRGILHRWAGDWADKYHKATEDVPRNQLRRMAVDVALICCDTFNLDDEHLKTVLSRADDASILLEMAMLIHDHSDHGGYDEGDQLRVLLVDRWQSTMLRSSRVFIAQIVDHGQDSLDQAVWRHWPDFSRGERWSTSTPAAYWLETCSNGLQVHFNTLNGRLLVNGRPLSRLPREFENHEDYRRILGQAVLEVMPSSVPGLEYSVKRALGGYELHFGIQALSSAGPGDLLLQAKNDCSRIDLVPQRVLQGSFPDKFIRDYSHWYHHIAGDQHTIELRPLSDPWGPRDDNWRLTKTREGPWQVVRGPNQRLINPRSKAISRISHIMMPLETILSIHFVYDRERQELRVELPRLKLVFVAKPGTSDIKSEQYRGMQIDEDQSMGTLVGLTSKLILRQENNPSCRAILIPEGQVRFQQVQLTNASGAGVTYTRVSVDYGTASRIQRYGIDTRLGRLVHRGTLEDMIFLAYLHGLTSFCLPDPLTNNTGTEQALHILGSQAIRSFGTLNSDSVKLLGHIRGLSPERKFYPKHIKSMQTVRWDHQLSFLSQHDQFYRLAMEIYREAEATNFLYPNHDMESLDRYDVDTSLLKRSLIRSAGLRVDGFGAEHFTTSLDAFYEARDGGHVSFEAKAHFSAKAAIRAYERTHVLADSCDPDLFNLTYNVLLESPVAGPRTSSTPTEIQYDSKWLQRPQEFVSSVWSSLPTKSQYCDRFALMIWLATIGFSNEQMRSIAQVLHAMLFCPEIMAISIPNHGRFDLSHGSQVKRSALEDAARQSVKPFSQCPESDIPAQDGESSTDRDRRWEARYNSNVTKAVDSFVEELTSQWPSSSPARPSDQLINRYIHAKTAVKAIAAIWNEWYQNFRFRSYLEDIIRHMRGLRVRDLKLPTFPHSAVSKPIPRARTYISVRDLYDEQSPTEVSSKPPQLDLGTMLQPPLQAQAKVQNTETLIERLDAQANVEYQKQYLSELRESVQSLQEHPLQQQNFEMSVSEMTKVLQDHRSESQVRCDEIYSSLFTDLSLSSASYSQNHQQEWLGLETAAIIKHTQTLPRLSPISFLQQLQRSHWVQLKDAWKNKLITYGVALAALQRAIRLVQLCDGGNELELIRELLNEGHEEWNPHEQPEWLLMECESDFLIRRVQQHIARQMIKPPEGRNATMQLNMGEGKSSVIVPVVTIALADGSQVVRVVVAKPQSRQMHQILTMRLGGLIGRRVYHLPIARNVVLSLQQANSVSHLLNNCMREGGILLVQPEHILSLQLMGLERTLGAGTENAQIGRHLVQTQEFLDANSRDVVDESDENFSVKFELIYTIGSQSTVEHSPVRWVVVQQIFGLLERLAPDLVLEYPNGIEVYHWQGRTHQFPRIRIFSPEALQQLLFRLSSEICSRGFENFPIARQRPQLRNSVHKYISEPSLTPAEIASVEESPFWTESVVGTLFLLRGLIAGGVIGFVLGPKRWRVNYGVDSNRIPHTTLAVPFRAKDSPAPRSEFSHPDVVISLTCLSYYYQGLNDEELFNAFERLKRDDQAGPEYRDWVKRAASTLPKGFHELTGVNLRDRAQCITSIFPHLRYSKGVIDYFLSKIVFAKEMREFAEKLSASGWDLAKVKEHPTTGFSGTNDSRYVLPLSVRQLDSPEQRHTNALVLEYLMQPENCVTSMPKRGTTVLSGERLVSEGLALLKIVTEIKPEVRVILDVGAQVIDLFNAEVSAKWLELVRGSQPMGNSTPLPEAVIFFDDDDTLTVIDMLGNTEPFQTSQYKDQTDRCLVFLDEAHTRGTDLKLPTNYRAAVTLGANLTKDRLVQACMRMRKLGLGQSVILCVPDEIKVDIVNQRSLQDLDQTSGTESRELTVAEVLSWCITQTLHELHRSIPLWATQGLRFYHHENIRQEGSRYTQEWAEKFLEADSQSLEQRYRPGPGRVSSISELTANSGPQGLQIEEHCKRFGQPSLRAASLQEEQERELCPEAEEERQVERPPAAKAREHHIHRLVRDFVQSGTFSVSWLRRTGHGFLPAFATLRHTSSAAYLSVDMFPRDLVVTEDFARTVEAFGAHDGKSDLFQRPAQWILVTTQAPVQLVVISPFEAEMLLPNIEASQAVSLRLYSPRASAAHRSLDRLDLYVVPDSQGQTIPSPVETNAGQILWLNIFAGQLYMSSRKEYVEICDSLGIASCITESSEAVEADGFIPPGLVNSRTGMKMNRSQFTKSPTQFLQVLLTRMRRPTEGIEKTHIGRLLKGTILADDEFS